MMKALNNGMKIVLASKSPRRRELLGLITEDFEVLTADTDERCDIPEPDELCEELAFRKACDVYSILRRGNRNDNAIVIGCDTAVYAGGEILGKPRDRLDAERMLGMLSGGWHTVTSGLALLTDSGVSVRHETTQVRFETLSESEISEYLDTDEPYDKAGAYGIQGYAARFVREIKGCYHNVVGLPVNLLYRMLKKIK